MLRNALGGSSLTVAICTVSALEGDADESLNTLMYASRMANIRNNPVPRYGHYQVSKRVANF